MMEETLFRNTQVHQPESTVFPWFCQCFCQCFCQYDSRSKMLSFFISMFMTLFSEKDSSCFPTILNDVSVKQLCCPCCVIKFSVCLHVCGHNRMLVVRNRFEETAETHF